MIDLAIVVTVLIFFLPPAASARIAADPTARYRVTLGIVLLLVLLLAAPKHSEAAPGVTAPRVPEAAAMYRRLVDQAVIEYGGEGASPARLAAQMHQESTWRPKVTSAAGAQGMAQFMPATAQWIAQQFPRELGQFDPWDPAQAIRGAAIYDRWLYERVSGATECDRWAFTLSAYNGGLGWVSRDKTKASATGADPAVWFDHTELHSTRARWARVENRGYVRRILLLLEPLYVAAGWSGQAVCA